MGTTAKRKNTVSKCSFSPFQWLTLSSSPPEYATHPSAIFLKTAPSVASDLQHVCVCVSLGFRVLHRASVFLTLSFCLLSCCLFAKIVLGLLWYKQMCQSDTRVGHHVTRLVDSITCPGLPDINLKTGVDLLTLESRTCQKSTLRLQSNIDAC